MVCKPICLIQFSGVKRLDGCHLNLTLYVKKSGERSFLKEVIIFLLMNIQRGVSRDTPCLSKVFKMREK